MENEKKVIIDLTEYQDLVKFKEEIEKEKVAVESWSFSGVSGVGYINGVCYHAERLPIYGGSTSSKTVYLSKDEALKKLENEFVERHNKEISEKDAEIKTLNDTITDIQNIIEEIKKDFDKYKSSPISFMIKKFFKREKSCF